MTDIDRLPILELIALRRELHMHPSPSGREADTARRIIDFCEAYGPDRIVSGLGGHGVAVVFDGADDGPVVMIRADLDAISAPEIGSPSWRSTRPDTAHLCGHDGHMAIVAGLVALLAIEPPPRGRVVLLFQPAEETGAGAAAVLADPRFAELTPDLVFALHNLPGYAAGEIVIGGPVFASASQGMVARLSGRSAHAAEPDKGLSPAPAMAELVTRLPELSDGDRLLTVTHARMGRRAFGVAPGEAEVLAALRAGDDDALTELAAAAGDVVAGAAERHGLDHELETAEAFPATHCDPAALRLVERAAADLDLPLRRLDAPMPWSEDFGHFTRAYPGAMLGLGAGVDHPALHAGDYGFPDAIIEGGVAVFAQLIELTLAR